VDLSRVIKTLYKLNPRYPGTVDTITTIGVTMFKNLGGHIPRVDIQHNKIKEIIQGEKIMAALPAFAADLLMRRGGRLSRM
jgi:hypothetical protein